MLARIIFLSVLFVSLSFSITVISPVQREIQSGDVIDAGTIGPGQTISIQINRVVTTGGIHGEGGYYDQAVVADLPGGWDSEESKLYGDPLQVTITAAPGAKEGIYNATLVVVDEGYGEKLENISMTVLVRITWDVMDFDVSPTYATTGPGQPARFAITIANKGSTSDVFEVRSVGSRKWEFKKSVFVPAHSSRTIYYEIAGDEEETYKATIKVVSLASSNIKDEKNVTLFVRSDLLGDYKATNHGVVLFPIFEALMYSIAGFLSNFF